MSDLEHENTMSGGDNQTQHTKTPLKIPTQQHNVRVFLYRGACLADDEAVTQYVVRRCAAAGVKINRDELVPGELRRAAREVATAQSWPTALASADFAATNAIAAVLSDPPREQEYCVAGVTLVSTHISTHTDPHTD
jgi:hypothetical protein